MPQRFEFQVESHESKKRLDQFLFDRFPHLGRMYLRELVRDEKCDVNGRWENRGYLLRTNDFVEIEVDPERKTSLEPEALPLDIVFEDNDVIVVGKPSGMLVHPTVRIRCGTLLNALAHHLNSEAATDKSFVRAGLVHRLDKGTSGLVVVAKNTRSHRILCRHFQKRMVSKSYRALAAGLILPDCGEIEAPIGRDATRRLWGVSSEGKHALSKFSVIERRRDSTLIELEPVTGRTNQLRIHLAHIGHPLVGDTLYGGPASERLCLHAHRIEFNHPSTGERLKLEASVPEALKTKGESEDSPFAFPDFPDS